MHRIAVVLTFCLLGSCGGGGVQSQPGRCTDHKRDGNETDVDCGGGDCPTCALSQACFLPTDCASNTCTAHSCASPPQQCANGVKDPGETDVDCGGGTCPTCANAKICQMSSDCQSTFCADTHLCAAPPQQCSDGKKDGNETDVDCGGGTCAPCSNQRACHSPSDCQSNSCTAGNCSAPSSACTNGVKDADETDVDCGGTTCAACGNGKSCSTATDCMSATCTGRQCVAPPVQCANGMKDAGEADVDCGGSCPKCINGKACGQAGDCASGACVSLVCGPPPPACNDGSRNGSESDTDCGGSCPRCANSKSCGVANDCASGICTGGVCVAPAGMCIDGIPDGKETDVDCGGGSCATCANGKLCSAPSDCASNLCSTICRAPASGCGDGNKDGTETDSDCGGGACPACANDKACLIGADCVSGVCIGHKCAAPPAGCHNAIKDGDETDVDCGGGSCAACANGKLCGASSDCTSNLCSFICQAPAPTCANGSKDPGETDVDCGGFSCAACANAKSCTRAADCSSGVCTNSKCAAAGDTCSNRVKDGTESDVDCGGASCPGCGAGKNCAQQSSNCLSQFCNDNGVCQMSDPG